MPDGSLCVSYPQFDSATITGYEVAMAAVQWLQRFETFIKKGIWVEPTNNAFNIPQTSDQVLIQNFGTMVNSPIQQGNKRAEQNVIETSMLDNIHELLKQLTQEVEKLSKMLPEETAREIKQDLDVLQAESTSKSPRKKWYELSADGVIKAATNLGAMGKPVIELVTQILVVLKSTAQ
jgi:hypothetical protein